MTRRTSTCVALGLGVLVACAFGVTVRTQSTVTPAEPPLVSVRVALEATTLDGGTREGSASAGGESLRVGDVQRVGVFTGAPGSQDLCGYHGAIGGPGNPDETRARHYWDVQAKPVAVQGDRITIEVNWRRLDMAGGGREQGAGDRRTITVVDGGRHVLDFVSAPPETSPCVNAVVSIEATLVEDPSMADAVLGYDLWLVDQDAFGRQITRHMEIAGRHGKAIDFRFLPIGWSSDGLPAPDDRRPDIAVDVSGTLKGRLQADGSVQLAVTPTRTVRIGVGSGGTGYREKILTARPGETVRMDIPPSGPAAVRSHRTSLSVTVRVR